MSANVSLTPKQERLIVALLTPHPIKEAARIVGISEKTAHQWLKNATFQEAFKAAQRQMFDQALSGLMQRIEKAIETLDHHMNDAETPANTQVRSAHIILSQAINVGKIKELEQQVEELREMVRHGK